MDSACKKDSTIAYLWQQKAMPLFKQGKYETAIHSFDGALNAYSEFSDAQMYKSICLRKLNRIEEANELRKQALQNGKAGFTINEDNVIYERYPYQIRYNS